MVRLSDADIWKNGRGSSKGNQLKWENGGFWYKADYAGYEGLAEYMISHLLQKTTLREDEFVLYDLENIEYGDTVFRGARSRDLLTDSWQIITLERLFNSVKGVSLRTSLFGITDHRERLRIMTDQIMDMTGLGDFGKYISKMLTIDTFFLNEDRHTHNIAILVNGNGDCRLCPIFDNAAGLLSDMTIDYPLHADMYELMKKAKANTFCPDFDEQLDLAEELYGRNIVFRFTKKDVDSLLDQIPAGTYDTQIIERVRALIYYQMRKYAYLFTPYML